MKEKAEETEEVIYRICRVCGESKPLNEFYRHKTSKRGRLKICKECQSAQAKQRYLNNREQIAKQKRKYQLANKKQIAERKRKYNIDNRERIAEHKREYARGNKKQIAEHMNQYRLTHKEQIAEQKRVYYLSNKEQRAEYMKNYYLSNKEQRLEYMKEYQRTDNGRFLGRCRGNRKRARKAAVEGDGLTPEEFQRIVKAQHNKCNMCDKRFIKTRPATMDHIIALSKGGADNSSNIQALCLSCNSSKHAKIPLNCIQSYLPK